MAAFIQIQPFAYTQKQRQAVETLALVQETRWTDVAHFGVGAGWVHQLRDCLYASQAQSIMPLLVAVNTEGQIRGFAQPDLWEIKEDSILRAFLTERNGVARHLVLPSPQEEDYSLVLQAFLEAMTPWWQEQHTTGELVQWPGSDPLTPFLASSGFQLDSICAARNLAPLFSAPSSLAPDLQVCHAQQTDEKALVDLFAEELRFHEQYTPFARCHPVALSAFRTKLQLVWQGYSMEEGAPLVIVIKRDTEVLAMAENTLLHIGQDDPPGFVPTGWYWCIDNVSVCENEQSKGLGRVLMQAIEQVRAALHPDLTGYLLWYNPDNPAANHFWPSLGFEVLWTTYQRRIA